MVDDYLQLHCKGTHIPWGDIVACKRSGILLQRAWPATTFYLRDGSHYTIRERLEEEGRRPRAYFAVWPRPNPAFLAFVEFMIQRTGARSIWTLRAGKFEWMFLFGGIAGGAGAAVLKQWMQFTLGLDAFSSGVVFEMLGLLGGALLGLAAQRTLRRKFIREYARRIPHTA